jgi:hypothetical protein
MNAQVAVKEQEKSSFVGGYLTPAQKQRLAAVATLTGCSIQALLGRLADHAEKLPGVLLTHPADSPTSN